MTVLIIVFCVLLLLAYLFDVSSKYTRIPSVILLLLLGWLVRQIVLLTGINIPDLNVLLPLLGSIGLILIVLEGSLELELIGNKQRLVLNSFLMALIPMVLLTMLVAFLFYRAGHYSFMDCLLNALPLAVISSAIAIPSVRNLDRAKREFVIYESSFSDVLGVLFFNFFLANTLVTGFSFLHFGMQLLVMLVFSLLGTLLLAFLLNHIKHHIKFVPIIVLVILIYEISKLFHLPGMIFILIFGIFIGNIEHLKHYKWVGKLRLKALNNEVLRFREIVGEAAFMVRATFFLLFGFLISTAEVFNPETILLALIVFSSLILMRLIFLLLFKVPVFPLLFIAPRGLITILLFLSIPASRYIPYINNSLVLQVILLSALFMMMGLMFTSKRRLKPKTV